MKYTGRIIGVLFVLANSLMWIQHQGIFHQGRKLGPFEIIFSSFYIVLGWWLGKIYDRFTLQKKELQKSNERLEYLSKVDGLTGIANRRSFDHYLQQKWDIAVQSNSPISLILFDIDYFKEYNDTYGHLRGDDCLKEVAATVDATVGRFQNIVARFGGEEFAVILPYTNLSDAYYIAEEIRLVVETLKIPHIKSKLNGVVTISAGVVSITPDTSKSHADFINCADHALYQSKQNGRNQICIYNFDETFYKYS
ncbi:GGDEF domain-containing protein [Neobacillus niacini]|uniref:GGDEF domain-containing protein n=1 Tax=Neobacillus niacini TaxID=86668 RepID=UPI000694E778|nr:diguanylate cyclase [Neobacillus niacini]